MRVKRKKQLLEKIEVLKKSRIKNLVDARIKEFAQYPSKAEGDIFRELCFCITTANCAAERCMMIQKELGGELETLPEKDLRKRLKELGYRFHNRSEYLVMARSRKKELKERTGSCTDDKELREWLTKNVKGLGYKEASHFLRNVGFTDVAIIDFHIIDVLVRHGILEKPKALTRNRYVEIEGMLRGISKETGLSLAELDLYLWYMETGKVLK